jgi:hypothetical protein
MLGQSTRFGLRHLLWHQPVADKMQVLTQAQLKDSRRSCIKPVLTCCAGGPNFNN